MQKSWVLNYDVTVDFNLETQKGDNDEQGHEINGSSYRPCGRIENSTWQPLSMMQNHRVLMHLVKHVRGFVEVLFGVYYYSFDKTGPWRFDLVAPLSIDGKNMTLGLQQLVNLTERGQYTSEVRYDSIVVSLVTKAIGKNLLYDFYDTFSLFKV